MRVIVFTIVAALLVPVSKADIERALSIGRGSDSERAAYHSRYVFPLNDPTVEQIEIVTPFRKVVLFAEERIRWGDHLFGLQEGEEALRRTNGMLTLVARLRFHPQNTYVLVPEFTASIGADPIRTPIAVRRQPVLGQPFDTKRTGSQAPILGAVLEADFDAAAIGQAEQAARVVLDGKDVAKVIVPFGRLQ